MFLGSLFNWMFPRALNEQLQDLYDDMDWGEYKNPNKGSKMSDNWITFDHNKVVHVWVCPDEECNHKVFVYPWYYEYSGTPVCPDCDRDMTYISTEINNG